MHTGEQAYKPALVPCAPTTQPSPTSTKPHR